MVKMVWPDAGTYVLAISGGADSMALLDIMATQAAVRDYHLVVAHFDHAMRADSGADAAFVVSQARAYKLKCVVERATISLGSEAQARSARYAFLRRTGQKLSAKAIVTAHHADDRTETILLNVARGTGWRGMVPFRGTQVLRPLSDASRLELRVYLASRQLSWREDPSNLVERNPRNFIRRQLLTSADEAWWHQFNGATDRLQGVGQAIDARLHPILLHAHAVGAELDGGLAFSQTALRREPQAVVAELILAAARSIQPDFEGNRRLLQELALFAVTASPQTSRPLEPGLTISSKRRFIAICKDYSAVAV